MYNKYSMHSLGRLEWKHKKENDMQFKIEIVIIIIISHKTGQNLGHGDFW